MSRQDPSQLKSSNDLLNWLIDVIAQAKRIDPKEIDPETPFVELGLDSMSAVSLVGDIELELDIELSPTLLWEYPNVSSLAPALWDSFRAKHACAVAEA